MPNPTKPRYHYQIDLRAPHLGGGYRLRCFEDDTEVAGGVFPLDADLDHEDADNQAHCDAVDEGESWLAGYVEDASNDATRPLISVGPQDV